MPILDALYRDESEYVRRSVSTSVPLEGSVRFTVSIRNTGSEPARLAVDYIVHHRKANGTQTGKTFKLTTATLGPGETLDVAREHSFRPITTRRYRPGPHAVTLQVNGVPSARAAFVLLPAPAAASVGSADRADNADRADRAADGAVPAVVLLPGIPGADQGL